MSDNDLSSKLAKGMRRAKEPGLGSATSAAPTPAATAPPGAPAAASNVAVQSRAPGGAPGGAPGLAGTSPRTGGKRFADQGDQTPPASLDRPWENLHPKRIWPD